jgi:hypothetical protein
MAKTKRPRVVRKSRGGLQLTVLLALLGGGWSMYSSLRSEISGLKDEIHIVTVQHEHRLTQLEDDSVHRRKLRPHAGLRETTAAHRHD